MKNLNALIISFFLCSSLYAAPSSETIIGSFETSMGPFDNRLTIRLVCRTETSCKYTNISKRGSARPFEEIRLFENVRPLENLTFASNALKYAIDQKDREIKNPHFAVMLQELSPALAANPKIAKCWNLSHPESRYMLACTLDEVPEGSAPLYLFASLLASCSEAFCGYIIMPLDRKN
jgi:hypothetical protein